MAQYTSQQRAAMDALAQGTFANPAMQTQGWTGPDAPKGYLQLGRGGAVNDPGNWQPPSPAGGAPVKKVTSQPVMLPRQTKLTTASFPVDALYRTPAELSAFAGAPKAATPPGWTQAGRNQFGVAMQPTTGIQRYAVDANGARTDPYSYGAQPSTNPAVQAAADLASNVSLPRRRPPQAPTAWDMASYNAANPAMPQTLDELSAYNSGQAATMPGPSTSRPAPAAPVMRSAPALRATNGYVYRDGQQVGTTRANGIGPAQQYDSANLMGKVDALNRRAAATGVGTNGYVYQNGQQVGTTRAPGVSAATQYEQANAAAAARARAGASKPSSQSSNSWFSSVTS